MTDERSNGVDRAHDVLAAEEFGVPAPAPDLRDTEAHDVLAAEEFVLPAQDPSLRHGPVALPEDPTGITEAHDVLAAEEFAMPAGRAAGTPPQTGPGGRTRAGVALGALAACALLLRKRRT